ncbi:MAG: hypothetical protein IPP29_18050 [Bacteroidetes bacterium]|nr:hypothetical protein [Bacteroidota bacterium]
MKYFFGILVCLCSINFALAQTKVKTYAQQPLWIQMIDNPSTNYFEAVKAYETYWQNHEKPVDLEEEMGPISERVNEKSDVEKKEHKRVEKAFAKMNKRQQKKFAKQQQWQQEMIYQCKRFEEWQRDVFAWVQEDGSILTIEQRQKMYEQKLREAAEIK